MLVLFVSGLVWVYLYVESSGDPVVDSSTGYVTFEKTTLLDVSLSHHSRERNGVFPIWIIQRNEKNAQKLS